MTTPEGPFTDLQASDLVPGVHRLAAGSTGQSSVSALATSGWHVATVDLAAAVDKAGIMDAFADGLEIGLAVRKGQLIGTVGRSGYESRPHKTHVHFEVYAVRSAELVFGYDMADGKRRLPASALGKAVAVNPLPYLLAWWRESSSA